MTDYVLRYQVWNGDEDGKQATFRSRTEAMTYLLTLRQSFPQAFLYDSVGGVTIA